MTHPCPFLTESRLCTWFGRARMHFPGLGGERAVSSPLSRSKAMKCKTWATFLLCEDSQLQVRENKADKQRIGERERVQHWTAGKQCTQGTAGSLRTCKSHLFPNAIHTSSTSSFKTLTHVKVVASNFTNPVPSYGCCALNRNHPPPPLTTSAAGSLTSALPLLWPPPNIPASLYFWSLIWITSSTQPQLYTPWPHPWLSHPLWNFQLLIFWVTPSILPAHPFCSLTHMSSLTNVRNPLIPPLFTHPPPPRIFSFLISQPKCHRPDTPGTCPLLP